MEFLFLSQGVCYISIYVITDDVFRPYFARPFRLIKGKVGINGGCENFVKIIVCMTFPFTQAYGQWKDRDFRPSHLQLVPPC